ncbi:MAG TPA: hypothetical protein ENN68_03120, partial [Methanomicrobia archaeon]|nr:hypothetical protein [Methanomicrobia archaeon]
MRTRVDSFGMKRMLLFSIFLFVGIAALPAMASALPDESSSGTVNREQQEILWRGDVSLTNGTTITVTAHNSGNEHEVNETTALGALDAAATVGAFNYTVTDEWGFL